MRNDKTLADVQPGGRVRLGDEAERARFEAWAREEPRYFNIARSGADYYYPTVQDAWIAWQAALSAQPSPGGKGDARRQWLEVRGLAAGIVKNLQAFADSPHKGAWCGALDDALSFADQIEKDAAAAYESILAARQPVGKIDEAAVLRRAAAVLYMWEDDPNLTGYMGDFNDACGILELLAQHAAPPAQAVDLGEMPDGWRLSKKTTCYQLSHGNDIIGNLVGPDAEENAAIIARVLDSQAVGN